MKRAGRFHGLRSLGLAAIAACWPPLGLNVRNRVVEANQATAARGLVQQIVNADTAKVPDIIRAIKTSDRRWTDPELRQIVAEAAENSKEKLHASLALLPVEPGQVEYLYHRLLIANPHELPVIRKALDGHQEELVERLWAVLENTQASPDQRFGAACALAGYVPAGNEERWLSASRFITERLLAPVIKNPSDYAPLLETLRPIRERLLASLSAIFRDEQRPETERSFATNILTDYASDQPAVLADLLMDAGPKAYSAFFPIVRGRQAETVPFSRPRSARKATCTMERSAARCIMAGARYGSRKAGSNRPAGSSPTGSRSARPCCWASSSRLPKSCERRAIARSGSGPMPTAGGPGRRRVEQGRPQAWQDRSRPDPRRKSVRTDRTEPQTKDSSRGCRRICRDGVRWQAGRSLRHRLG